MSNTSSKIVLLTFRLTTYCSIVDKYLFPSFKLT